MADEKVTDLKVIKSRRQFEPSRECSEAVEETMG
jgi:hypothetical protein